MSHILTLLGGFLLGLLIANAVFWVAWLLDKLHFTRECPAVQPTVDSERLNWLERFLQLGGSRATCSVGTNCEALKDTDFHADGIWAHPYLIGYDVELERGCYRFENLSDRSHRLRPAIDAAMKQEKRDSVQWDERNV